jgi:CTP synthase
VKEKISNFCHVAPEQVICIHDLSSIYHVPILMDASGVMKFLTERLQLTIPLGKPEKPLSKWRDLARRVDNLTREVNISLIGKYTRLEDAYASVSKSLQHASIQTGHKLNLKFIEACNLERAMKQEHPVLYHEAWQALCMSDGIIVPGGFGQRGIEGKIRACQWARENKKPFLGICLGLQAAVIEFARNVLGHADANSTEVNPNTQHPLVIDMPEHFPGQMGGTMRLGKRTTIFKGESTIKKLYGNGETIEERHRHRYEVNPKYVEELEAKGLKFVGHDSEKQRMEIMELDKHPYYVAVQYHPEYLSRPLKPSAPFLGLILASIGKLQTYLNQGCRLSPRQLSDASSDDEETLHITNNFKKTSLLSPPPAKLNGVHKTNGYLNGGCGSSSTECSSTEEVEK